jgi:hypothetical protein
VQSGASYFFECDGEALSQSGVHFLAFPLDETLISKDANVCEPPLGADATQSSGAVLP